MCSINRLSQKYSEKSVVTLEINEIVFQFSVYGLF